ncbi:mannitol dehydrogenase [Actinobaculum suis]|uniref:Mannitol dehydrogenase n=1 Tax=Actinobaculum suis TaxID=1657 RepID=A0A7Z9C8J5_9ACTO|nr:mannitol dehydrogenase family protein [Actinobaculum suis]VDG76472.1 mannitol dehydrogenase [Actinobaculum suis]
MKLNIESLSTDAAAYAEAGVRVPRFDVAKMQAEGKKSPRWVHLGAGNIFRVFQNRIADDLLADGEFWPITAVQPRGPESLERSLRAYDDLTLAVTLSNAATEYRVIAGICESLASEREEDYERLREIFTQPQVSIVTITITEKGYVITDSHGNLREDVLAELANEPDSNHLHTMVELAGLLYARYQNGGAPITLISTDNFSHNGDVLKTALTTIVEAWAQRGAVPAEFVAWLEDEKNVTYPITVIDKITPRPSEKVAAQIAELGFTNLGIELVGRTPMAGFVNAEPAEYLLIEDKFAGARPPLEKYGVILTDRETCDKFERMKVTTCLNPLHTALAITGCLLRFPTIDSEMRDADLSRLVHILGYQEAMPVVTDPGVVSPEEFLKEVLEVRFPNQALPDSPQRIAMDTSQKLPIRFGVTLTEYQKRGLDMDSLVAIPVVFAAWCRYLLGVADDGEAFEPSSDPLLEELQALLKDVKLGQPVDAHAVLQPILSNANIFGLDLYTTPLASRVEALFTRMVAGPGAVRATIHEEISK